MKIACISDIHGNKLALESILKDIEFMGADRIFCLGDLAMGGYDPNYTIEKLFSLENIDIVQGNTDKLIVDFNEELNSFLHKANPLMAGALELDDKEITIENKNLLKNLPISKTVEIDNIKFELCHGSPRAQDENIFPDTSINIVEEACKNSKAEIILCGHTHIPCGFSLESGKTLINVGSVGRSMTKDKMPVYLLITINPDGSFSFEHRRVIYDNKKVSKIIEKRNFKNALEFSKLYI